ncbi:MAG: Chromatin structure-remodeling complex protein rsc9 [Candelina mexicana]|nr:MAG: Chromatin structure-remodeling complex protein rsc9 [Candelina mexicana]
MAPRGSHREPSIERTPEYDEFMEKLAAYHEARGTRLEREPRISNKSVDLLRLYQTVTEQGGYDVVTKTELGWRKIGQGFHFGMSNLPALAFSMKSAYYKNLAAYEISTFHHKEPPPKEILEDVTARGGDLLNRTIENYKGRGRETGAQLNGQDSEGTGDERQQTPKEDRMDVDEPGSTGGRVTRGLRQAPPQRQLFHPDLSSSRHVRHLSTNMNSPQPASKETMATSNAGSNPSGMSSFIANYEPKPQMPLTLRPVITPAYSIAQFRERQKVLKETAAAKAGRTSPSYVGMMLPGTGFEGPNIYVRTLLSLRSGIPEEQDFALHHLVKISHERGDKFKFDAFPGLAEGLIEKVLEISSLFYDVAWEISYRDDGSMHGTHTLDGLHGTADILQRIVALMELGTRDDLETEDFSHKLNKINEAGLVLRNMAMLEENANYLSNMFPLRDFICIALHLPDIPSVVELKHYALDIAEQLTKYLALDGDDALYGTLLTQLESSDRGMILTALRAISRISMNLEENNRLDAIPMSVIKRVNDFTLLDDEELVHACLDFLYQYTAVVDNVESLVEEMDFFSLMGLVNQLVRLLLYGAKKEEKITLIKRPVKEPAALHIPRIPQDLVSELLQLNEPERSANWLRSCFEEDSASEITQIALWQAYQAQFAEYAATGRPLLPAAEFIKNVSSTFTTAAAQVLQGPTNRFIIKGIRYRHIPKDLKGRPYLRCHWLNASNKPCSEFLSQPKDMWDHLINHHLRIPKHEDGRWDFSDKPERTYTCRWTGCTRYPGKNGPYEVGMHIKQHLPDTSSKAALHQRYNKTPAPGYIKNAEVQTHVWYNTAVDERGDAAGLPLTAALVLRNLARNLPRPVNDQEVSWTSKLFTPVMRQLFYVMAHNRPLAVYMTDLTAAISAGE